MVGFGVWERRDGTKHVTMPARVFSLNGERRSYALLRPIADATGQARICAAILQAYDEFQAEAAQVV